MKYKILKIATILTMLFVCLSNCALCDTIITQTSESNGRIKTVGGGFIVISNGGSNLTYQREVNNEYFGDVVYYKKNILSRQLQELAGRVESLDRYNAIIYTPVGKIEIQRYKIKNIIIKVPSKGY